MNKTLAAALCLTLPAALPTACLAADPGFYVGLEVGKGRTEITREDDDFMFARGVVIDDSSDRLDDAFGIYGGYTISKYFGVELAYTDLGETSYTTVRDVPPLSGWFGGNPTNVLNPFTGVAVLAEQQRTTFESEAMSLAVLGRVAVASELSLIAKVGLAVHRIESTLQVWFDGVPVRVVGGEGNDTSGAGVLAIGSEWNFHPSWAVRLQAQRHFALEEEETGLVDREDVTLVSGGIEYRF